MKCITDIRKDCVRPDKLQIQSGTSTNLPTTAMQGDMLAIVSPLWSCIQYILLTHKWATNTLNNTRHISIDFVLNANTW